STTAPNAPNATATTAAKRTAADGPVNPADLPSQDQIHGWIQEVFDQGVRRPGYQADRWAEDWVQEQFEAAGLEAVRREPITVKRWEPTSWSLTATPGGGETREITGFPLPFSPPIASTELTLRAYDGTGPTPRDLPWAALVDAPLIAIPADLLATGGSAPEDSAGRIVDPDGTLTGHTHVVPFAEGFGAVMQPAADGGATAFIGSLVDYPGDSCRYYVPYDGEEGPIPGLWISGTDGAWLHEQLASGPVHVTIEVASTLAEHESFNILGELPGADDQTVMIGSHHDGPWSSAVEDASGISLVLAQANYWARQPEEDRPHRLLFILQGGHMSGGAGLHQYIEAHRDELADVVLEVHLEHAALEFTEEDGKVVPTGEPVPRWWFTSRIPDLEAAVFDALTTEQVNRSMLLAPDAFGTQPPTDGAFYHSEGVPIVQFLEAPFYLFDEMDTMDKIDREHLVPITRAVIRIIDSTKGVSAEQMRDGLVPEA
ncbi:MAG TPA: M28 family peptidase, partial [Acidimicrobiales bacterium]|nr:M28 family peptidase [Acidimicrobiales bacterium]